jgi:hypothetical protein
MQVSLPRRRALSSGYATEPSDLANIAGWWKADSFALSDGDAIGEVGVRPWVDSSGNGRDATQGTALQRPLYKTNIFGLQPAILFDASNDNLAFTTWTRSPGTEDFTIIAVVKLSANVAAKNILFNTGTNNQIYRTSTNRAGFFMGGPPHNSTSNIFSTALDGAVMMTWRVTTVTSVRTLQYLENLTARGTLGGLVGILDLDRIGNGSFSPLDGYVGEIVLYDSYKDDTVLTTIYNDYFKPKWGLP